MVALAPRHTVVSAESCKPCAPVAGSYLYFASDYQMYPT